MAASLPSSIMLEPPTAGASTPTRATATPRAAAGNAPATALAPAITLPLRFVLTGLGSLLASVVALWARPDLLATYHYNQYAVAVTHLFVLGFLASVVMGAMYQLVPVALETRLYSERLARWQFVCHLIGFAGMVVMFWIWNLKQVGHFGSLLALGVALFLYNLVRTLARVPRWNVVATGIASAGGWLAAVVLLGLGVAAAKCTYDSPALPGGAVVATMVGGLRAVAGCLNRFDALALMHAHAHLGVVGFFVMMIVAVSYKLLPMFALSELQSPRRAGTAVLLLNLGLAGLAVAIALRSPWKLAFAALLASGLVLYGLEVRAMLRARKRRTLDWGLKSFLTALALLIPTTALGLILAWPGLPATLFTTQLETVYALLGLLGVVGFAIIGFLHKIVPFLVWYAVYSPHVGRHQVPSLADLYRERLQVAGYVLHLAALALTLAGTASGDATLVRWGVAGLTLALLTFFANVALMLSHFVRPQLQPLAPVTVKGRP